MQEASYSASLNWQRNGVNSRQLMLWSIVYYCVLICKDWRGGVGKEACLLCGCCFITVNHSMKGAF